MSAKRVEEWRAKRDLAWKRSGYSCHYCDRFTPERERTLDHVVPKAFGGPDANWNLVASCEPCNGDFGDSVRKCDCRDCGKVIQRFHRMRRDERRNGVVVWTRTHRGDDELLDEITKRIAKVQRRISRMHDPGTHEAAALRGKMAGMREVLGLIGTNHVDYGDDEAV